MFDLFGFVTFQTALFSLNSDSMNIIWYIINVSTYTLSKPLIPYVYTGCMLSVYEFFKNWVLAFFAWSRLSCSIGLVVGLLS